MLFYYYGGNQIMLLMWETLPFVKNYVANIDESVKKIDPKAWLSNIQKIWLAICITAIAVTNSIC